MSVCDEKISGNIRSASDRDQLLLTPLSAQSVEERRD